MTPLSSNEATLRCQLIGLGITVLESLARRIGLKLGRKRSRVHAAPLDEIAGLRMFLQSDVSLGITRQPNYVGAGCQAST